MGKPTWRCSLGQFNTSPSTGGHKSDAVRGNKSHGSLFVGDVCGWNLVLLSSFWRCYHAHTVNYCPLCLQIEFTFVNVLSKEHVWKGCGASKNIKMTINKKRTKVGFFFFLILLMKTQESRLVKWNGLCKGQRKALANTQVIMTSILQWWRVNYFPWKGEVAVELLSCVIEYPSRNIFTKLNQTNQIKVKKK